MWNSRIFGFPAILWRIPLFSLMKGFIYMCCSSFKMKTNACGLIFYTHMVFMMSAVRRWPARLARLRLLFIIVIITDVVLLCCTHFPSHFRTHHTYSGCWKKKPGRCSLSASTECTDRARMKPNSLVNSRLLIVWNIRLCLAFLIFRCNAQFRVVLAL